MDIINLSSGHNCWTQKLCYFYLWIDYCQNITNRAANAFFQYPQQSLERKEFLQAENVKILHCLQFLLAKVFNLLTNHLSPFHQIYIYRTTVLFQLCKFLTIFQTKIAHNNLYANIEAMKLRFPKLQNNNNKSKTLRLAVSFSKN